MGWTTIAKYITNGYYHNYTPDTNLQQADELKARLRELGYDYAIRWVVFVVVRQEKGFVSEGFSKLSESAALVEAVSKIPQEGD